MATIDKLFLDAETNDEFIRQLMSSVVLATKEANNAPKGTDFEYYAMSPKFRSDATKVNSETMGLIQRIVSLVKPENETRLPDDIKDPVLYEQIVDAIDTLLEGADKYLDGPRQSKLANTVNQTMSLDKNRLVAQVKDIPKPQLDFFSDIDNVRENPFCPRIKDDAHKYHAITNLDLKPKKAVAISDLEEGDESNLVGPETYFAHPYETELRRMDLPVWCEATNSSVSPSPTYSQHPFTLVDTSSAFARMLTQLEGAKELAVDLEHHSHHTFQGLTCLIQVLQISHSSGCIKITSQSTLLV
jgi:exosome complex exonuclease RRP6